MPWNYFTKYTAVITMWSATYWMKHGKAPSPGRIWRIYAALTVSGKRPVHHPQTDGQHMGLLEEQDKHTFTSVWAMLFLRSLSRTSRKHG